MKNSHLEAVARDLLKDIWADRNRLAPNCGANPFSILDPRIAASHLGFEYVEVDELRDFGRENGRSEVAGLIDRQARKIAVSKRFPVATRKFTGGHEIGHAILHPGQVMHRDRPIAGIGSERQRREPVERDADHFSACFFIPGKLLESKFESRFGAAPLRLDDASAFWLSPSDPSAMFDQAGREFAFAVAGAISYGGPYFDSLAAEFGVSISTMAFRLEETGLIEL